MKTLKQIIISLLIACPLLGSINQNEDLQLWMEYGFSKRCLDTLNINVYYESRLGDDISQNFLNYVTLYFDYHPKKWISIVPCYRQLWSLKKNGGWERQFEPFFYITLRYYGNWFVFSDRNRGELIVTEKGASSWIYRNQVKFEMTLFDLEDYMVPYVSNEIFLKNHYGFIQNRFSAGIQFAAIQNLQFTLYYLRKTDAAGRHILFETGSTNHHWNNQNVIGTQLILLY